MFEHLSVYPRVVVTGPQRSGTTITAQMIAHDTGHTCIDETEFGVYDVQRFRELVTTRSGIVVQAPHMLREIVDDPPPAVFVVLMRRELPEIHASDERIGWTKGGAHRPELGIFDLEDGDPAELKYRYWDEHPHTFESCEVVNPRDIETHPLFVKPERRRGFAPKQTRE